MLKPTIPLTPAEQQYIRKKMATIERKHGEDLPQPSLETKRYGVIIGLVEYYLDVIIGSIATMANNDEIITPEHAAIIKRDFDRMLKILEYAERTAPKPGVSNG